MPTPILTDACPSPRAILVTVMTLSTVKRMKLENDIDKSLATTAVGVGTGSIVGRILGVTLNIEGEQVECDVAVLDDTHEPANCRSVECLIGLDVLLKLDAVIDVKRGVALRGKRIAWIGRRGPTAQARAGKNDSLPAFVPPQHAANANSNTFVPPVNEEVEAELDELDKNCIEDIIKEEDSGVRNAKFEYLNSLRYDEDEDEDSYAPTTSDSDFDMSGV